MSLWRRKRREDDLARELRTHLDLEAEEQQRAGVASEDARYAAIRAFGNRITAVRRSHGAQEPALYYPGDSYSGAWDRRQYGDLQCGRHGAASALALPRCIAAGAS